MDPFQEPLLFCWKKTTTAAVVVVVATAMAAAAAAAVALQAAVATMVVIRAMPPADNNNNNKNTELTWHRCKRITRRTTTQWSRLDPHLVLMVLKSWMPHQAVQTIQAVQATPEQW